MAQSTTPDSHILQCKVQPLSLKTNYTVARSRRYLAHEAARIFATVLPWIVNDSPSQVTLTSILTGCPNNLLLAIYIPGWREAL